MENITLPQEISSFIGSENKDFVVKAGHAYSLMTSFFIITVGIGCTAFTSILAYVFFGPLLQGKEVHLVSNGMPIVASPDNLGPIILPMIIIGIFALIGISFLFFGIYLRFKKGGYFVGTPIRLVCFQNGAVRSIDWEQFSGDIKISGNAQRGSILLQMRTGITIGRANGTDGYVPNAIYISEISNVFEIEQICRRRIKENDPTPATTGHNNT